MEANSVWWRDGVIYQIYPRSFADSNADGIGDLNGITSRLDYLSQLGVDAVWLSPIYPSPDVDFGYDVSEYCDIDPKHGTLADFDRLVQEAHNRGIRIILDLVLNHTSDQHPWFQQSRSSKDNPYRDWYLWREGQGTTRPPNNWQSVFGGSAWQPDAATGEYYYHMFYREQPDLNWRNPAVRRALLDVFKFWLDRGVDGFRLDVFNLYFKDDRFRDNPPRLGLRGFDSQQHLYDCDRPEMLPLLREIRALLDSYPERYAVGETFLSSPWKAASYCAPGLLHAAFDFSFLECPWRPARFLAAIQRWEEALHEESWPNYVLGNHDVRRIASRYARGEDDERLKVAAALLLTLRGTPFMYYGDEIGMRDIPVPRSEIKDRVGQLYWPFYRGRDGCRSPMQWDASPNAGFSPVEPWLPVHPNFSQRNAAVQQADPNSLYHFYRRLLQLRREYPALRRGMFRPLTFEPQRLLAYLRQTGEQTVLVALNFGRRPVRFATGGSVRRADWTLLLSNKRDELGAVQGENYIPLEGEEALILLQM
jgi:alpha-glucosidase